MATESLQEGKAHLYLCPKVFYNPHMRLSRDLSVAVIRAYAELSGEHILFLDAFTATAVRGIRYTLEADVEGDFLDNSREAVKCALMNLAANSIEAKVIQEDFVDFAIRQRRAFPYTLVELDPFGSPVPYLWPAMAALSSKKRSLVSVTATDGPVLCGVQKGAAEKYYQSYIPHNSYCHETGLRALLKKIALTAAEFNLGVKPLASFYYRHQWKVIVELERSDKAVRAALSQVGFFNDPLTGERYGPIWLGNLHNKSIVERAYSPSKEAAKYLSLFVEELDHPPLYYDLPALIKTLSLSGNMPSVRAVIEELIIEGYSASPTHFSPQSFKTDAPFDVVKGLIRKMMESL